MLDKKIKVKFNGGREGIHYLTSIIINDIKTYFIYIFVLWIVVGMLKGWDPLLNLVVDSSEETVKGILGNAHDETTRELGLIVCRGTMVLMVCPMDGTEEIANPFIVE